MKYISEDIPHTKELKTIRSNGITNIFYCLQNKGQTHFTGFRLTVSIYKQENFGFFTKANPTYLSQMRFRLLVNKLILFGIDVIMVTGHMWSIINAFIRNKIESDRKPNLL